VVKDTDNSGVIRNSDPGSELVEEVDVAGGVVRTVTRAQMRAERLRHRSVFIAVINDDGEVLVHRRSETKDLWPGYWDIAVGGVVAAGEEWDSAAHREVREEVGIEGATLTLISTGAYEDDMVRLHARMYMTRHNGPFTFPDGEVVEARWLAARDLMEWLSAKPFLPDSLALVLPHLEGFSGIVL
jgi:isopentenyldiphosphate isomerase